MKIKRRGFLKGLGLSLIGVMTGVKLDPAVEEKTEDPPVELFTMDSMTGGASRSPFLVLRPHQAAELKEAVRDGRWAGMITSEPTVRFV